MGGATRKARVMFTCEHEVKNSLEAWAESENRTVSNLVETLIEEVLATRGMLPKKQTPASGTSAKGTGGKGRGKGVKDE